MFRLVEFHIVKCRYTEQKSLGNLQEASRISASVSQSLFFVDQFVTKEFVVLNINKLYTDDVFYFSAFPECDALGNLIGKDDKTADKKKHNGCHCAECGNFNEYAEPNRPDGKHICYSCRENYRWKYKTAAAC